MNVAKAQQGVTRKRLDSFARGLVLAGTICAAALGHSACAEVRQKGRLVSCGATDCLLLSGTRADGRSPIFINDRLVQPQGGRGWKVLLPVSTVKEWSLPGARRIAVTTLHSDTRDQVTTEVDLPIGMLGSITELGYIVIPQT